MPREDYRLRSLQCRDKQSKVNAIRLDPSEHKFVFDGGGKE